MGTMISNAFGVSYSEYNGIAPCFLIGIDISPILGTIIMMGWFVLWTFPAGIMASIIFL